LSTRRRGIEADVTLLAAVLVGFVLVLVAFTLVAQAIVAAVALLLDVRPRTALPPRLAASVGVAFVVIEGTERAISSKVRLCNLHERRTTVPAFAQSVCGWSGL